VARLAEALGFDTVWVLDQPGNCTTGAFNLIAHLAGRTTSIEFGTWLPEAGQSREVLEQIECTHRITGGRLSLAVTYPVARYYDETLAYQVPGLLVEMMPPSSRHVVPGTAFLASCQVTYQDIEGDRPRFTGSFAQITADIRALESAGAGEVILDFTGSASLRVAADYAFHLRAFRAAVQPGRRFAREDPFDLIT
jgi:alkanesulfonate monooxygenase SsuD/methylene tetrahydromethanopterin reductase-like flavin-dependent oxidoreductase (luciferase family)